MGEEGHPGAEKWPIKHKHTVGQDRDNLEEVLLRNRRIADPVVIIDCERNAARHWDTFYKHHQDRFFKNKNWTDREFKELANKKNVSPSMVNKQRLGEDLAESSQAILLEVGCGPGNMLYPVRGIARLEKQDTNRLLNSQVIQSNATIKAHCCDFSPRAIELIRKHPLFDEERINPFVFDLVKNEPDLPSICAQHPFGQPSIVSLIFVLSSIPPQHHRDIFALLTRALPIGGALCFRDFAHGDLCQVRFHQKASAAWGDPSLLSEQQDYYRRGDNTFSYFFNLEEIKEHVKSVGLEGDVDILETHSQNRKTGVHLYRRFIQGRWRKVR